MPRNMSERPENPLDRQIERWMEKEHVPGLAACIVKGDKVVWSGGYGWADMTRKIRFTPDTLFQIASVSKVITATAIMQLRDRGLLGLDDDVGKLLKFPVRNPSYPEQPITFEHLLRHRSSINDTDALCSTYAVGDPTMSIGKAVSRYFTPNGSLWSRDIYRKHAPGAKECYSNAGFALLGYLVEVIAEQPLEDYLQQNVYRVLGMNETSFYISKLDYDRQARPYTYAKRFRGELYPGDGDGNLLPPGVSPRVGYNEHALYSYPTLADGMVRTSVNQLAKFMIAMMNGDTRLLKRETVSEMLHGKEQGLCWCKTDGYWGHDGNDPGCSTEMMFDLETKVGFIVFANVDTDDLEDVRDFLEDEAEEKIA
jgi:CubicO group peptidase (beta-lactamase class C family)